MSDNEKIIKVNIEKEMRSAYIDYSMSVIISRALPDVRDGLKPVHRRVLFGMQELGLWSNKAYKKSARLVGDVLGKYHPHGDSSVYYAMVRMAQDWSMRYPLIDGQGNYGSVDGDPPAAMRYTETRLQKIAEETLADLDKDTVDFQLNFDDTLEEPTVLPTRIPTLLINGASGIAVGMATNMPPHNLTDTIDAIVAYIDNNDIQIEELIKIIKAPDFPTGGIIYGYQGVKEAYLTGRGKVVIRAKYTIEETASGKPQIVFTEIPYLVNKAEQIQKIADLVNEKKIEEIVYANDESDRNGMRIVVTLKKEAIPNVVLNKIFKNTLLQSSFSVNNICLVKGRPQLLNLKQLIHYFVEHRHDVVLRRTKYELKQAEDKAHILEGLLIALDHLDEVITLIRASETPEIAKNGLISNFGLSEIQAKAILEMRLQRLTGLERDKIKDEYTELLKLIEHLKNVIADEGMRKEIIKKELTEIRDKYGDKRRTEIIYASEDFNPEDFYKDEEVVITISNMGYIKRTPLSEYKTQARGGKGSRGSTTREEDFIRYVFVATMHNTMLLFTDKGKCFWLKVYEIPEGSKTSKGRAIQNLLNIDSEDFVRAYINVKDLNDENYINNNYLIMCTKHGIIKKTKLVAYSRPRQNGINAIAIRENDNLLSVKLTNGNEEVMLATYHGKALRFNENNVRPMGRMASGVRGIKITDPDKVVGMICISQQEDSVLVVSENGYGKRSEKDDYRLARRGGKGVKTINVTEKTGKLVAIKDVNDKDDLMIMTKNGITIRLNVNKIRIAGRATQGVRLINLYDNDAIASVAKIEGGGENKVENPENIETTDIQENPELAKYINLTEVLDIDPNSLSEEIEEDEEDDTEEMDDTTDTDDNDDNQ